MEGNCDRDCVYRGVIKIARNEDVGRKITQERAILLKSPNLLSKSTISDEWGKCNCAI